MGRTELAIAETEMQEEFEQYLGSEHLIDFGECFHTELSPLGLPLSLLKVLGAARGRNSHLFRKDCSASAAKATAAWTSNGNRLVPY